MNTPLQELIEKFEYIKDNNCNSLTEVVFFDAVIALTETFLDKEKEHIIEAFNQGQKTVITEPEQYYNETYN